MNLYARPSQLVVRVPAAADKLALSLQLLGVASRQVEIDCRRRFWTRVGVRLETAQDCRIVYFGEDLLALEEVAPAIEIDRQGLGTFEEVWDAADLDLVPVNAARKLAMRVTGRKAQAFPVSANAVRVTGRWGYGDGERAFPWDLLAGVTVTADAPDSEDEDADPTTLVLSAAGVIEPGMTLLVDDEQMFVKSVLTTVVPGEEGEGENPDTPPVTTHTATVTRGVNDTEAVMHTEATASVAAYPELINLYVLNLAIDLWNEFAGRLTGQGGVEMSSEKIGDYEYVRANLRTFAEFRAKQQERVLSGFVRAVI